MASYRQDAMGDSVSGIPERRGRDSLLFLFHRFQNFLTEHVTLDHHPGNVERAFEEISFGGLCDGPVTVEITIPLRIIGVGEMGIGPFADPLMAVEVFVVARGEIGIE